MFVQHRTGGGALELRWLEDYLALSATQNFSRAAEARNLTQPAFSRRIRNLELWLGTTLVDRSTYPVRLTAEGVSFRAVAEEVAQILHRARDEAKGRTRPRRAMISFAALHTIALSFFPEWFRDIEQGLGPVRARLAADNLHDCVQALVSGSCDFLICYAHPAGPLQLDAERYPSLLLSTERLLPVSAPLPDGRPRFDLNAPGDAVRTLAYAPDTFLGKMVDLVLARNDAAGRLDICYENSMADALKAMAQEGQGVAFIPESSVRRSLEAGTLVPAGGDGWTLKMEVRLYRSADHGRRESRRLWDYVAGLQAKAA